MNKFIHKTKTGLYLAWQAANIRSVLQERNEYRDSSERYHTERQILFDESQNMRIFLANKYLTGRGIEIGPSYLPLPVPQSAKVRYVDIADEQTLYEMYPDIQSHKLAHIDVVDDAESLKTFKDNSENFIIANHFLEHTINPIQTLSNFYRVLQQGGILYMAVPDKRFTFDIHRPITPLERLVDFYHNPKHGEAAKFDLYRECALFLTKNKTDAKQREWAKNALETNYSVHFNVWAQHDVLELILYCVRELKLDFDFETIMKNNHELIVILRKFTPPKPKTRKPQAKH